MVNSNISYFSEALIHFLGKINEDLTFEYGNGARAVYGCGATLKGEFWYFGGNNKRQVKL